MEPGNYTPSDFCTALNNAFTNFIYNGSSTPAPPIVSYNCLNGNCTDPGDGTGLYQTLVECEDDCGPVPPPPYTIYTTFGTL